MTRHSDHSHRAAMAPVDGPLAEIIAAHRAGEGPLLPILHAVQARMGCVDAGAEAAIAEALNLSRAEVHGVVSFYHDFTAEADPRPVLHICRAEACQARGCRSVINKADALDGGGAGGGGGAGEAGRYLLSWPVQRGAGGAVG